tara:strand:- start:222 stop:854 length:633 start_codon:yes stop_codon:yes gene_type:complete
MVFPVVLAVGALALYFLTKPKSKEIKKEELSYPFKKDEENQKKNKIELISRMEESGFNKLHTKLDKLIVKSNLKDEGEFSQDIHTNLFNLRDIQKKEKNIHAEDIMKLRVNNLIKRMEELENTKETKKDDILNLKKNYYSRTDVKEFWKDLPKSERRKLIKKTNSEMKEELIEKYTKMTWKKIADTRINEGSNTLSGFVNFVREKYNNKN